MERPDALLARARKGEIEFSREEERLLVAWYDYFLEHADPSRSRRDMQLEKEFGTNVEFLTKLELILHERAAVEHRANFKIVGNEEG